MKSILLSIAKSMLLILSAAVQNEHLCNSLISVLSDSRVTLMQSEIVLEILRFILNRYDEAKVEERKQHISELVAENFQSAQVI